MRPPVLVLAVLLAGCPPPAIANEPVGSLLAQWSPPMVGRSAGPAPKSSPASRTPGLPSLLDDGLSNPWGLGITIAVAAISGAFALFLLRLISIKAMAVVAEAKLTLAEKRSQLAAVAPPPIQPGRCPLPFRDRRDPRADARGRPRVEGRARQAARAARQGERSDDPDTARRLPGRPERPCGVWGKTGMGKSKLLVSTALAIISRAREGVTFSCPHGSARELAEHLGKSRQRLLRCRRSLP